MYEDGQYKHGKVPVTRQSNVLRSVMIGKKSWGLWVDQWTDGIVEWTFTREEILSQFTEKGIVIPDSFLREFDNMLERKRQRRNDTYLNEIRGMAV